MLVMIAGEAGSGKSRLASETLREARGIGMTTLTGRASTWSAPPPYQPLIDQLEQAIFLASPDRMRAVLGENAPEIATLMPALRQRYEDIPEPPSLPPEQERRYLLHGVGEFFRRACTDRPLALVFEDVHWADESTVLLLDQVTSWAAEAFPPRDLHLPGERSRRRESARASARPTGEVTCSRRAAAPPARSRRRRCHARVRAGSQPPKTLVDLVVTEADGNPFFVEEVFRHLRETGKLFDDAGRWLAGIQIGETEVPAG